MIEEVVPSHILRQDAIVIPYAAIHYGRVQIHDREHHV